MKHVVHMQNGALLSSHLLAACGARPCPRRMPAAFRVRSCSFLLLLLLQKHKPCGSSHSCSCT